MAVAISVVMTYLAFEIPGVFVKIYVGAVIVAIALAKRFVSPTTEYHRRRLIGFAALAGLNKGSAGSGYGPNHDRRDSLRRLREERDCDHDDGRRGRLAGRDPHILHHLDHRVRPQSGPPPVRVRGGFLAAILALYTVRVLPNRILGYLVPSYALSGWNPLPEDAVILQNVLSCSSYRASAPTTGRQMW
ncbi:MAG: hypothetical protein V5A31_07130 [Haloferacaceae archaeon]